ncbi:MAG: hypothetical protein ICV81_16960 [Flavisolibacter sp.]|nr:hypothetical protein [Flavisolibacter sp.]
MNLKRTWEQWSNWELWPMRVRYFPIIPCWFWYCLRARSFWFFTPSNPTLTFGGFEGENKKEMYEQLPSESYPKTIFIHPQQSFEEVKQQVLQHQFSFPFVVKPDIGMSGILFRIIENVDQLQNYHGQMKVEYMVQERVNYPEEFSVFYYRFPYMSKGVITGFLRKELLSVTGDGKSTLGELVLQHPTAKHRYEEMYQRHLKYINKIIPAGEKYFLSDAANFNRGGRFVNLKREIDASLLYVFDELNKHSKGFYYGRYDLKAASLEDLKKGINFSILEYNGSGAEPNHIYQSGYSLFEAYAEILYHWKVLYQISKYNHENGIPYWPFLKGLHFIRKSRQHFRALKKYDLQLNLYKS